MKPDPLEKDYERSLQKIATRCRYSKIQIVMHLPQFYLAGQLLLLNIYIFRGVVQLFNAVKKHQTQLDKKMKTAKTEGKKERVRVIVHLQKAQYGLSSARRDICWLLGLNECYRGIPFILELHTAFIVYGVSVWLYRWCHLTTCLKGISIIYSIDSSSGSPKS